MPDVIIWMIAGGKRIAYYRIPAQDLLFSENPMYRGRHCGKTQSITLKVNQINNVKLTDLRCTFRASVKFFPLSEILPSPIHIKCPMPDFNASESLLITLDVQLYFLTICLEK